MSSAGYDNKTIRREHELLGSMPAMWAASAAFRLSLEGREWAVQDDQGTSRVSSSLAFDQNRDGLGHPSELYIGTQLRRI